MDAKEVDHYRVLGLPSGENGFNLTLQQITSSYKAKALQLHPDKRRDDPHASANFQKLHSSYQILKNDTSRKLFDDCLRAKLRYRPQTPKNEAKRWEAESESNKRERERAAFEKQERAEEERRLKRLREEIDMLRQEIAEKRMREEIAKDSKKGVGAEKPSKVVEKSKFNVTPARNHEALERCVC